MKTDAQPYEENLKNLFVESGALLNGHFLLSSGLHSDQYMQCALLLAEPAQATALGAAMAKLLALKPDLVISPAMGGVIIGQEVARAFKVRSYFTERENGVMVLRRGFHVSPGQKVVVVEDVITTGKSTAEVIALLKSLKAEVLGALSIVNRASQPLNLGVPVKSLLDAPLEAFPQERCPFCKDGVPVVKPGSRGLK